MSHLVFYWGVITAVNAVTLSLWIGSMVYYCTGLQPSLGLLDKTQKISVSLQGLKKLFQLNWINAFISLLCQGALAFHHYSQYYSQSVIPWNSLIAFTLIILLLILQFYNFSAYYQKARRSIRPKQSIFDKINRLLQLSILLGILDLILLNL